MIFHPLWRLEELRQFYPFAYPFPVWYPWYHPQPIPPAHVTYPCAACALPGSIYSVDPPVLGPGQFAPQPPVTTGAIGGATGSGTGAAGAGIGAAGAGAISAGGAGIGAAGAGVR
ncbi:hypothetical protein WD019_12075 [Fictibacillus sp. Mic-4]|uniref:hypothetical protein n=1 Tax=Fictibacillus sp. Mic-4 TaxID=3132826 RepID=UPI003CFB8857